MFSKYQEVDQRGRARRPCRRASTRPRRGKRGTADAVHATIELPPRPRNGLERRARPSGARGEVRARRPPLRGQHGTCEPGRRWSGEQPASRRLSNTRLTASLRESVRRAFLVSNKRYTGPSARGRRSGAWSPTSCGPPGDARHAAPELRERIADWFSLRTPSPLAAEQPRLAAAIATRTLGQPG